MIDNFEAGLTELAAKIRTTGVKKNAGCASFVLRARDEIRVLTEMVENLRNGNDNENAAKSSTPAGETPATA